MNDRKRCVLSPLPVLVLILFMSCHGGSARKIDKDIVTTPYQMDMRAGTDIQSMLRYAAENGEKLNDSILLTYRKMEQDVYDSLGFTPLWSDKEHWKAAGDSLLELIAHSKEYGLFPSDYHYSSLAFIRRVIEEDTVARKNAALWSRADVMMTDAFLTLVKHLKQGRLDYDSVTRRKDSVLSDSLYKTTLAAALQTHHVAETLQRLEPKHRGYDSLKAYLKDFLAGAQFRQMTWIDYPNKDSAALAGKVIRRLRESGYIDTAVTVVDTAALARVIRNYQTANKLRVTGKPTQEMVYAMNYGSDWEKFKRIAITLDKYKLLPDSLPKTYVWVDLPAFALQVINADTVVFESKVIVGAPRTRTPLLTSSIVNFVTFPQWTVPESIIFRDMLPAIKRNIDYLRKQNLMVVDWKDSVRDPSTINWARLNKNNFPYQLKQREGDDNSLGVMKFNFVNKYDVYLHDTNGRWMFDKTFRALSHGCVRVQEWRRLSNFLVRNDTIRYRADTLKNWIKRQEKHTVYGFAHVPIFIRDFTVEGKKGKVQFYDDIYGEDRLLRNRYFAEKPIL
jgi:murein L,D-transpeptidase YcbB/YkuD